MSHDSIHALWVDPLAFEPLENGAPYLPEKRAIKVASDGHGVLNSLMLSQAQGTEAGELGVLVGVLRAAVMVHHSHHWLTRGHSYYGDHLMFDTIYSSSLGFIDQVAERAVGLGSARLVDARVQAGIAPALTSMWCPYGFDPAPEELVSSSLGVERCVVACIEEARTALTERGLLTSGTDNLLQGVADKHEEFVYLLQQREGGRYSYDSR
jgi:DNA-binding ferritin-like protein